MIRALAAALTTTTCLMAFATPAAAQTREFNVPAGPLRAALDMFARQSGRQVIYSADVRSARSGGVRGVRTADDALNTILAGTGFVAKADRTGALAIVKTGNADSMRPIAQMKDGFPGTAEAENGSKEILVTGSRIRGAAPTAPLISLTLEQMQNAGQNTLPGALQSIPQNFGGGQNPGVSIYAPGGGNTTGASSINLRGLGPDATLTLINGHRLSYGGQLQAVDISSIPLLAIDKIEVVADGASALYGSDAVAGVANIILRRNYSGVEIGSTLGTSTDGGDFQQQYSMLAGTSWKSGSIMAAYEFGRNTDIDASQRSYAAGSPGNTLYPSIKRHSVVLTGHQDLTPYLTFEIDAFYNKRWTDQTVVIDARGNYLLNGALRSTNSDSFAIAPSLKLTLGGNWRATLSGLYAEDRGNTQQQQFLNNIRTINTIYCACNNASSVELGADGPLFHLPAGDVRVALGIGYRNNTFRMSSTAIDEGQNSYFGYGEVDIPIVSPFQQMKYVNRLHLSGAMRFERYPGMGQVATPKIGLIYAPTSDIEVKGSWGKSFKAPTLYQMYFTPRAALYPVSTLGGSGYPSGSTALMLLGGNTSLQPERATTWSASFVVHPRAVPGARVEVSYFDISYRGRVVTPLTFTNQALSNSIYSNLVTLNPSEAEKAAAVAIQPFFNLAGVAYDPTKVVALVQNTNMNSAIQNVRGVDVAASYDIDLGPHGKLALSGSASYIDSDRRLSSLQPVSQLAGTIFNPPHIRGRAGGTWSVAQLTLGTFVNYIGGVTDVRTAANNRLDAMTTADVAARLRLRGRAFGQIEISISVQNLFNDKPTPVPNYAFTAPPFDSTNYSPIGRFVIAGLNKRF